MEKRKSLSRIVGELQKETRAQLLEINDIVYSRGVREIDAFGTLIRGYHDYIVGNGGKVGELLEKFEGRESDQSNDLGREAYISRSDAIKMWKSHDESHGNKVITNSGYEFRLRGAEKSKELRGRREGRNVFYAEANVKSLIGSD